MIAVLDDFVGNIIAEVLDEFLIGGNWDSGKQGRVARGTDQGRRAQPGRLSRRLQAGSLRYCFGFAVFEKEEAFGFAIGHFGRRGNLGNNRKVNGQTPVQEGTIKPFEALNRCQRVGVIITNNYVTHSRSSLSSW